MFYSVFYMPKPNFSLREEKRMKVIGYLVRIGRNFHTVQPSSNPVTKHGKKQFWFYHNHQSLLAVQQGSGLWSAKNN